MSAFPHCAVYAPIRATMADQRFAALTNDPRYRLPSKKTNRTALDPRFNRLLTSRDFTRKAKVDRYGRKIEGEQGWKGLEKQQLYRLDGAEQKPAKRSAEREREVVSSSAEASQDSEGGVEKAVKRDPARDGGFSDSESSEEESSSEEEESADEAALAAETAGQEQQEEIPLGEVTTRIAAVNLDWDHIRASDIMAVAQSFIPTSGRIERVSVYPSEFGRERLEREELEGPPREIFASSKRADLNEVDDDDDDDDDESSSDEDEKIKRRLLSEQANEGNEFDTAALRTYQLERLRYYYAVIICDSTTTAKHLYDTMDGREYLTTANFFDLRFIPDSTSFDEDTPREECAKLPEGYAPNDFRTEALTHSKVRLTWDEDDVQRKEVQKRAFSRGEIEENDLQAYIGSDDSDADSIASRKSAAEDRRAKRKEEQRRLMRERLGLGAEAAPSLGKGQKGEVVGDMQITFTSGLSKDKSEKAGGVFENEPQDEESTRERYIRKERERKQKRKERAKAGRSATSPAPDESTGATAEGPVEEADAGFDDPFFTDPSASRAAEKKAQRAAKAAKREEAAAKEAEAAANRKELELLMAEDGGDAVRHFDMREIEKAEKAARRQGKKGGRKGKGGAEAGEVDPEAGADVVNTRDPRFAALFESHEYAIDPSNPKFKGTGGMRALLEEGRKRKRVDPEEVGEEGARPEKKEKKGKGSRLPTSGKDDDLKGLVARLKKGKKGSS